MSAYTDLARFKGCVRKGEAAPAGARLRKEAVLFEDPVLDAPPAPGSDPGSHPANRRRAFTISTARVDRENDTVAVAGWDLDAYRRNPVVLWGHDGAAPPIGRCVEIGPDGDALRAVVEFVPFDVPVAGPQAEMVMRLCATGFLSACSVGFRPLEWTVAEARMKDDDWWPALDFQRQELLEFSVVTIPANPDALAIEDERRAATASAAVLAAERDAARVRREAAIEAATRRRRALRLLAL